MGFLPLLGACLWLAAPATAQTTYSPWLNPDYNLAPFDRDLGAYRTASSSTPMSAWGQLETFPALSRMSVAGGKADINFGRLDVCL